MPRILSLSFLALLASLPTQAQSLTPKQLNGHAPFTLGTIDTLQSTVLKEKRALNIYLPADAPSNMHT